jgi:aminoglycoside phosphotransferase (APT) family kinase protein
MGGIEQGLATWFAGQLPDADDVRVEGLDRVEVGHSAETLLVTVVLDGERRDLVIRVRPEPPGLLEPYDLHRQFTILRALEPTPVRSPRVLWFESSGDVLGREFYVMERLPGRVIERGIPGDVAGDSALARRMCESMIEQIAAIHVVDLEDTRLADLPGGRDHLTIELDHWSSEIERVKRGRLPALELLVEELRARQPEPCPRLTLVHGDTKPGNFAFVDGEVSGVFDWEMATIGDPLTDIGWAEVNWRFPGFVTAARGAPPADELVERWEALTGIRARHRPWYRALQGLKIAVILLVGGHLYGSGHSTDTRLLEMAYGVDPLTQAALADLGIDDGPEPGPVLPVSPPGQL